MLPKICRKCEAEFYGVTIPFEKCPNCETKWEELRTKSTPLLTTPIAEKITKRRTEMAKAKTKTKKSKELKHGAQPNGGVWHKAYTYTNKAGKTVTVRGHWEVPTKRGGTKTKVPKKTKTLKAKKGYTIKTFKTPSGGSYQRYVKTK
jgi:ribosomal protein L40E